MAGERGYCREFLEKVTVSVGANGTVRWSDAICPGRFHSHLLWAEVINSVLGFIFLIVLPMNVLNLGYPWFAVCVGPCGTLHGADTYLFLPANYDDLYQWSVESYSDFWAEFWKYSNIVCSRLYDEVSSAQCLSAQRHPERKSTDVTISLLPSS